MVATTRCADGRIAAGSAGDERVRHEVGAAAGGRGSRRPARRPEGDGGHRRGANDAVPGVGTQDLDLEVSRAIGDHRRKDVDIDRG